MLTLTTPLNNQDVKSLRAGDEVGINGVIYTARDAAHQRLVKLIAEGKPLPFPAEGAIIYYVGPTPAKPGEPIGSAGPTTSVRMDGLTIPLLEQGLKGMIGKGGRSPHVVEAMKEHGAVYFAAVGGAAALIAQSIKEVEVIAYPELGAEAVHRMVVENFPVIVAIDSEGNNLYDQGVAKYRDPSLKEAK
ncbi:MAG: Fe-S-containing hydro-lyase [Firmicutes bacterium]|nr:Fe-S-containing hydro-lyase [Bacillota bacterium]